MSFSVLNFRKLPGTSFVFKYSNKKSFFVASDVLAILYNKPCKCTGDQYLSKRLFMYVFWINAHVLTKK